MRYHYPDIVKLQATRPNLHQRIVQQGRFDTSRLYVDLPDTFDFEGTSPEPVHVILGFGDIVAGIAQPIAKAIDAIAGTNLVNCGGCKERQENWNKKFPIN